MKDWYLQYCKDHKITVQYGKARQWHENSLRRSINKASVLEQEDLSKFQTREEAEAHLVSKSQDMTFGMAGITLLLFQAILGWIIRKLLDESFGNDSISSR